MSRICPPLSRQKNALIRRGRNASPVLLIEIDATKKREELKKEPEAEVIVAVVGRIVVAIGDATVPRVVVPATATVHAVRPRIMETLLVVLIFSDEKQSYRHEG